MPESNDLSPYALTIRMVSSDHVVTRQVAPCTVVLTDDSDAAITAVNDEKVLTQKAEALGLGLALVLPAGCSAEDAAVQLREKIYTKRVVPSIVALPGRALFFQGVSAAQTRALQKALLEDVPLPALRATGGRLQGCVAVVTGSAQGFGRGIAEAMAAEGAAIVVADLNAELGEPFAQTLNNSHGEGSAIFAPMNVTNLESIETALQTCVRHFGGLDMFVANAGVLKAGGLDEMDEQSFDLVTNVNYKGYFLCAKAAATWMQAQHAINPNHFADIIQINSKSGLEGSKRNFAYAGGKFGAIGLTQSFALELIGENIKVNSVCPGNFFDGPLWSDPENGLFVQYLHTGKVPGAKTVDDVRDFYLAKVPMRRGCTPLDVCKAIFYLYEQTYETGQAIPVTGGQVMLN